MAGVYNLILRHVPDRQSVSDYMTIKNMMVGRAPDIDVHVVTIASPVMGVDIIREHGIREHGTGRLFVLKFNSHGLVWHLSSKLGYSMQRHNAIDFYDQFNALSNVTNALIEATRTRAI